MKHLLRWMTRVGFYVLATICASTAGTHYYVAVGGGDESDGTSRDTAFATVQRGVDALAPGDTLIIAPGEYFGSVSRDALGGPDADTIIRAEIPGTVVIRGDVPVQRFSKVPGHRFTYVAGFGGESEIHSVIEQDTLAILRATTALGELDFSPGRSYHDAEANELYISSTDMAPVERRRYTAALLKGHGIELENARRVRLEGLAVTGFGGWGIRLYRPDRCVVSDCRIYLNGQGLGIDSSGEKSGHNIVERCMAWANNGNGFYVFYHRGEVIRNSTAFLNSGVGFHVYGVWERGVVDTVPTRQEGNLAWGNGSEFQVKAGYGHVIERVAGPGNWVAEVRSAHVSQSVVGILERGPGSRYRDNVYLPLSSGRIPENEFADPVNRDYRLQATSGFRGAGDDGGDSGLPYATNVFYVSTNGSDAADGLSVSNAWATFARAVRGLRPGDTLYVVPGRYAEDLVLQASGTDGEPITIRGRGTNTVVLAARTVIENGRNLKFERLHFKGSVAIDGGGGLTFEQCAFTDAGLSARDSEGLRIVHCDFSARMHTQVELTDCRRVFLAGNRFDNTAGTAVGVDVPDALLYADYNSYRAPATAWRIAGRTLALDRLPEGWERYGTAASGDEAGAGLYGRPSGPYRLDPGKRLRIEGPFLHAVGSTSANVEWFVSRDASRYVRDPGKHLRVVPAWGETPECEHTLTAGSTLIAAVDSESFGGFSLTGLKPSTRYYVRLLDVQPFNPEGTPLAAAWNRDVVSFMTAAGDSEPATYYVAPDGDDADSGRAPNRPWRTLYHAGAQVRPGDTVLIAGGTYQGRLPVRATGTPDRPITFAARPGARVVLDANLSTAIVVQRKSHLRFDGLFLHNVTTRNLWTESAIRLFEGQDIRLTRIFFDGRLKAWSPAFVYAAGVRDLLVRNCVGLHSWTFNPRIFNCPGFRMENSVIVQNKIGGGLITGGDLRNNIITDCQPNKATVPVGPFASTEALRLENNAYVMRPERELHQAGFSGGGKPIPLADFELQLLRDGGLTGDPRFAVLSRDGNNPEPGTAFQVLSTRRFPELTFADLFATDPEFVRRGIGLNPDDFLDFYPETGN